MKTTRSILETLTGQAHFRSLGRHRCYRRFLALLPPRFQDAIAFVYVRNATLHVALRHPGYKMELNYNKELLKSLLTTLADTDPQCAQLRADKVVLFVSRYARDADTKTDDSTVPHYHEQAQGTFVDRSRDPRLRMVFARLRETIHARQRHHA